ncbi:MAG: single-stranded DNA-binding protein [Ureaplasma sp.]|nr:single-stranded DNA-binding protein [Ureaplasma sp.]
MNKVVLVGHLAKDPVARVTKNGNEQSTFSIGVNDFKSFEESYFFNCTAWNSTAKYINNNLVKGQLVAVDGRLINRSYLNSENRKVYITEVVVDSIKAYGTIKKNQNNVENSFVQSEPQTQSMNNLNFSNNEIINNEIVYDVNSILNSTSNDDLEDDELVDWGSN